MNSGRPLVAKRVIGSLDRRRTIVGFGLRILKFDSGVIDNLRTMEANLEPTGFMPGAARRRRTPTPLTASSPSAFAETLRCAKRTARRMRARRAASNSSPTSLDAPPPEVRREMAAAARACQTLAAQGKELRFDRSADGRVSVELIDGSGRPLDVIGPSGLFRLLQQAR
jgi:hypothetical protein